MTTVPKILRDEADFWEEIHQMGGGRDVQGLIASALRRVAIRLEGEEGEPR